MWTLSNQSLPDESDLVLISRADGIVSAGKYSPADEWWLDFINLTPDGYPSIVAVDGWQPFPLPLR